MAWSSMSLAMSLVVASSLVLGCVGEVGDEDVLDDVPAEPEAAEPEATEPDKDVLYATATCTLQVFRDGAWRPIGPSTATPPNFQVKSSVPSGSWSVAASRHIIWKPTGKGMDCGEAPGRPQGTTRPAPRTCDAQTVLNDGSAGDATTYHCDDGTPSGPRDINTCIGRTGGTKMTVDSALKYCIGSDAKGNLRSYLVTNGPGSAQVDLANDAKCLLFRCR